MNSNYLRMITAVAIVTVACLITSIPVRASEIDDKIEASARNSYVFNTYLKGDDVKVNSKDGAVTLSGTVNENFHIGLAGETVRNLPDVRSVDNRLELKAGYPLEKSNERLAMDIKAALRFHRNVNAANTEVYVEEGIVTLRGQAANEAQKELTAEYADIDSSVRGIRNEMTVGPVGTEPKQTIQEIIDDASITAQVKMALLAHRSTSGYDVNVETTNGVVALNGIAENAAQKDLIAKLVSDIYGVNSVINKMTVKTTPSTKEGD